MRRFRVPLTVSAGRIGGSKVECATRIFCVEDEQKTFVINVEGYGSKYRTRYFSDVPDQRPEFSAPEYDRQVSGNRFLRMANRVGAGAVSPRVYASVIRAAHGHRGAVSHSSSGVAGVALAPPVSGDAVLFFGA